MRCPLLIFKDTGTSEDIKPWYVIRHRIKTAPTPRIDLDGTVTLSRRLAEYVDDEPTAQLSRRYCQVQWAHGRLGR